jgi:NRAMP (natural resistance-associated macrophage protein)-like metal ion transporter
MLKSVRNFINVYRKKLFFFLLVMGPGIITACADDDAGGIATYSIAGAHYGYRMLWMLFLITISLAIVQEMCARMAIVTGKGLSDLIRENFGLKWTVFAMAVLLVANFFTCLAEFAGIASSLEIFNLSRYFTIPIITLFIWLVVVQGSYKFVEKIFLGISFILFTYVISGFMAKPDWSEALKNTLIPNFSFDPGYVTAFIGTIGTTITPWMQFFLQSSIVDKGLSKKELKYERADVFIGAFITDFVAFFIIVSCAATLFKYGIRIETAKDAAIALRPIAGRYTELLFALGLFGASTLGAFILPLSTSYAVCEAFGWERGVNHRPKNAPVFYGIYTAFIFISAIFVLSPRLPLMSIMLLSQVINGILLPVILIFMLLLINDKTLMGRYTNSQTFNAISWATVVSLIGLTLILLVTSVKPLLLGRF